MKEPLTALFGRLRARFGASDTAEPATNSAEQPRRGPDLYECESCGTVLISRPERCPSCDGTEFTNAGNFD